MEQLKSILIILPVLVPFLTGISMLFIRKKIKTLRIINLSSSAVLMVVSCLLFLNVLDAGYIVNQLGGWKAPFGISFVADYLSSIMVVISSVIMFSTSVYSFSAVDREREKFGYYSLLQFLMMGINGSFLTGDLFNLYVWFEVMLISSFVLLALGGKEEQLEGAIKYVTLNLISSAFFLAGVGILYGTIGTLNMADAARTIASIEDTGIVTVISMLFLVAFGIKSAVFPLFFWLPASYHTPPAAVSAIFAGLLTKVGVYAMFRVFSLIFIQDVDFTHSILLVVAGFTMVTGVLGAAAQSEFRKVLSFHIISQIGYMILGLALFSPLAVAGGVFYIVHHIIVKTNLFFISGLVNKIKGSYLLKKIGGVYAAFPLIGLLFLIPAMSLAGIPPLSGFWAKFTVAKAGLELGEYFIVGISLFVGLLTLFSMTKIWTEVFWKPDPRGDEYISTDDYKYASNTDKFYLIFPIVFLALITITIGLKAEPFFNFAASAAEQLLNPQMYINSVMGGQ